MTYNPQGNQSVLMVKQKKALVPKVSVSKQLATLGMKKKKKKVPAKSGQ